MIKHTQKEALAVILESRNFMAKVSMDMTMPPHASAAISAKVDALDRYLNDCLGGGNSTSDTELLELAATAEAEEK